MLKYALDPQKHPPARMSVSVPGPSGVLSVVGRRALLGAGTLSDGAIEATRQADAFPAQHVVGRRAKKEAPLGISVRHRKDGGLSRFRSSIPGPQAK
jgi:hypothetical protein